MNSNEILADLRKRIAKDALDLDALAAASAAGGFYAAAGSYAVEARGVRIALAHIDEMEAS